MSCILVCYCMRMHLTRRAQHQRRITRYNNFASAGTSPQRVVCVSCLLPTVSEYFLMRVQGICLSYSLPTHVCVGSPTHVCVGSAVLLDSVLLRMDCRQNLLYYTTARTLGLASTGSSSPSIFVISSNKYSIHQCC